MADKDAGKAKFLFKKECSKQLMLQECSNNPCVPKLSKKLASCSLTMRPFWHLSGATKNQTVSNLWQIIQDAIGDANKWRPVEMRKRFWTRYITNQERMKLATFVFCNGLNPEIFMEWVDLMELCRDPDARKHFTYLFERFEMGDYPPYLYAYVPAQQEWQYLNGNRKWFNTPLFANN